jgi:hypothetical protein
MRGASARVSGLKMIFRMHARSYHAKLLYVNIYLYVSIRMSVDFLSNALTGIVDSDRCGGLLSRKSWPAHGRAELDPNRPYQRFFGLSHRSLRKGVRRLARSPKICAYGITQGASLTWVYAIYLTCGFWGGPIGHGLRTKADV